MSNYGPGAELYKGDGNNAALIRTRLSERLQTVNRLDIKALNFSRAPCLVTRNHLSREYATFLEPQ